MNTDYDLNFIKAKTEALGTALFYNSSKTLLKFPTSVINLSRFDENGNLWFQLRKPYTQIDGMDKTFPGQLYFYKKGCSCYTTLDGIATIAAGETDENVAIKFKISNAECFYKKTKTSSVLANVLCSVTRYFNPAVCNSV